MCHTQNRWSFYGWPWLPERENCTYFGRHWREFKWIRTDKRNLSFAYLLHVGMFLWVYLQMESEARVCVHVVYLRGGKWWPVVNSLPANAGDLRNVGLIPGLGRSPGGGPGDPLQYSWQENPTDREARQATVHGVTKSWTWLKWLSTCTPEDSVGVQPETEREEGVYMSVTVVLSDFWNVHRMLPRLSAWRKWGWGS